MFEPLNHLVILRIAFFALIGAGIGGATAAESIDPEEIRFFENRVRPVISGACYDCHGPEKQKANLRVDRLADLMEKAGGVPAIVPGDAMASLLYQRITSSDPEERMPKDDELAEHEIADIKRWIEMGAPWPENSAVRSTAKGEFAKEDRDWWSFQPLRKVKPPNITDDEYRIENDVDRFIVQKLQEADLDQAPEAEPRQLLRRVYFNFHGLPPSEEQIEAFLADERPGAYGRLIDELLDAPEYGQRWAQHWLDLVRYAESDGYREDAYRPQAWPYRDYVIRSFNEDKPYDQFVREQLAGDEIAPNDPETLIGTAFLRHGIYEWNQSNAELQRDLIISELTGITGELFLGLSVSCAQCHDHKFDPILQRDYFRMKSFFEPLIWRDDKPLATDEEIRAHAESTAAWEAESAEARAAWESEKAAAEAQGIRNLLAYFPPAVQQMYAKPEADRTPYEKQVLYFVDRRAPVEVKRAVDPLKAKSEAWKAYRAYEDRKPEPLPRAFVAEDVGTPAPPTFLENRSSGETVEPGFLTILAPDDLDIEPLTDLDSTGRRSALAEWITDPENPLATRVIVNRLWQYHFGRGLSGSASDFGRLGEEPSHPELLDWLTVGFIENGWSFKWLHRQILHSATYRQSSLVEPSPQSNAIDPENRLLWRFRPRRLDAEQLRDALLVLSGEFVSRAGGPSEEGDKPVRSIFTRKVRNSPDEVLSRFDAPPGFRSVAKRNVTNTPLQSLLMVNGEWPMERARAMAERLRRELPEANNRELFEAAFLRVMGRPASDEDSEKGVAFLLAQDEVAEGEGLTDLFHVLINSNEFLYLP